MQLLELLKNPAIAGVGGGALALLIREAVAFALHLRAARLKADGDPTNDAEAEVLERTAQRLEGGKQ